MGTTINNRLRMKELRQLVTDSNLESKAAVAALSSLALGQVGGSEGPLKGVVELLGQNQSEGLKELGQQVGIDWRFQPLTVVSTSLEGCIISGQRIHPYKIGSAG